ncbi:MAG: XisI protein [Leptolyngbyaceae cyanobacterium RM1_405_57]|nr:XisI protein [Leptolyngbyaceae cyanobacterium RM1_405_57]
MDKLERYRGIIQNFLKDYAEIPIANGEIESYTVFDTIQDHYQVMSVGWDGNRRVYGCVIHLDIKDGKVWLEHNSTEIRVAHELMAMGVEREDIVLGFQHPELRQYTEFSAV